MLFVSCTKDNPQGYEPFDLREPVITAVQEGWNTKSSLDGSTGLVYWSPSDAISVFFGQTGIKYISTNKEKAGSATFVCSPDVIGGANEGLTAEDGVYGLYPFNLDASQKDGVISTSLPDRQTASEGTFSDNLFITVGKASADKLLMGFYNVCGGVRFRVTTTGITSVTFKGNNAETLAGDVRISFGTDGYPRIANGSTKQTEISLECPEGFKTGVWYYLVSLPAELTKGYTMTFSKEDKTGSASKSSSVSVKRSIFGSIDNADYGVKWVEREDPTPSGATFNIERDNVSRYLDDAYASYTNRNGSSKCVVKNYCLSSTKYNSSNRDDVPEPVSLKWDGTATSVMVFDSEVSTTVPVKTVEFTSSSSVDIFNLTPGKTYSYKVNDKNSTEGTFSVEGRRRMLKISDSYSDSHANNCRDFGGIRTTGGKLLKYGLMFRGTNLDKVTAAEKSILVDELGIKLDVDLRESGVGKDTSPIGVDISNQRYQATINDLSDTKKMKITITDILTYVSQGKPVYIHCKIGSDRTGYVCMLLQALLGAPLSECDIDYELTSFAGGVTSGSRTRNTSLNAEFRKKFITNTSYSEDQVPQSVEDYVINTLGISRELVNSYRKAMGVTE